MVAEAVLAGFGEFESFVWVSEEGRLVAHAGQDMGAQEYVAEFLGQAQ
jgi:hypothetical protein